MSEATVRAWMTCDGRPAWGQTEKPEDGWHEATLIIKPDVVPGDKVCKAVDAFVSLVKENEYACKITVKYGHRDNLRYLLRDTEASCFRKKGLRLLDFGRKYERVYIEGDGASALHAQLYEQQEPGSKWTLVDTAEHPDADDVKGALMCFCWQCDNGAKIKYAVRGHVELSSKHAEELLANLTLNDGDSTPPHETFFDHYVRPVIDAPHLTFAYTPDEAVDEKAFEEEDDDAEDTLDYSYWDERPAWWRATQIVEWCTPRKRE